MKKPHNNLAMSRVTEVVSEWSKILYLIRQVPASMAAPKTCYAN